MGTFVSPDLLAVWTILQEASNQPLDAMTMVGEVIRTRTTKKWFSDGTIASTVLFPEQFSGWMTHDPNRIRTAKLDAHDPVVVNAQVAWERSGALAITKGDVVLYHDVSKTPWWAAHYRFVMAVGAFRCYGAGPAAIVASNKE